MLNEKKFFIITGVVLALFVLSILFPCDVENLSASHVHSLFQSGFATLSLDKADFSVCPSDLTSTECWVLTVAQGNLAQYVEGYITKAQIKEKAGKEPESNLKIDITYGEQSCEYVIKPSDILEENPYNPMVSYLTKKTWTALWYSDDDAKKHCKNPLTDSKGNIVWGHEGITGFWCIDVETKTGAIAYKSIESPYVHTKATIEVTKNGDTKKIEIDTNGNIRERDESGVVYVVWQGYLPKQVCPSKEPYYAFYKDGRWHIGYASNYENYKLILASQLPHISENPDAVIEAINAAAEAALEEASFGTIENATELRSGIIKVSLPSFVSVPVYTFYISADWLRVVQPYGEPEITSVKYTHHYTTGKIYVTVKNVGDERDTFTVYAICDPPFEPTREQEKTIYPGDEKTFVLEVSADTDRPVERYCTVYAESTKSVVSEKVRVKADPYRYCTPNEIYCSVENGRDVVVKCNEYGTAETVIEWCGPNERCVDGKCVPIGGGYCNNNGLCEPWLGENYKTCPSDCPYQPADDCDYNCEWYDVPCIISEMVCRITRVIVGVLMWAGVIVVGLLVLILVVPKLIKFVISQIYRRLTH